MKSLLFDTLTDKAREDAFLVSNYLEDEHLGIYSFFNESIDNYLLICYKPCKWSLLHTYLDALLVNGLLYEDEIENDPRSYWENRHNEELFRLFGYSLSNIGAIPNDDGFADEIAFADKVNEFYCDKINARWVEHVFYTLYDNKDFLFRFNSEVAKIVTELKKASYPQCLKKDGVVYRQRFPEWLKKAVRMRDRNRCQICGKDLSGTYNISHENYDHIIPLESGGTNDPTNIQLTCESCNKQKGARSKKYKNIMIPFW